MKTSRREFFEIGAAGLATAALASADDPKLGLIFPTATRPVPEEGLLMYPKGVKFIVTGLGLATMTPEGYDKVIDRIPSAAEKLAKQGVQAIVLMGTSLTFYKGAAFNVKLAEEIKKATGLPTTTMSTAVVEGLRKVGAKRVAVSTAYNEEGNQRLRTFLTESGFEVLVVTGLGIEKVEDVDRVTQPQLLDFSAKVRESAPGANAMLVSCGGLRTLEIIAPLEKRTKVPVVSSTPHALWAGVRLLGLQGIAPGYGTLLSKG